MVLFHEIVVGNRCDDPQLTHVPGMTRHLNHLSTGKGNGSSNVFLAVVFERSKQMWTAILVETVIDQ